MSRITAAFFVWMVVGSAQMVQADESQSIRDWIKYLNGEWTSELDTGSGVVKGTAAWRKAAKGNASIGRFTEGDKTAVEIGGWQSDTNTSQVNGFNSEGDSWQIVYKTISGKGGQGTIRGTYERDAYTGNIVLKVIDDDNWQWTIKGKNSKGEDFTLSSKLTRKND